MLRLSFYAVAAFTIAAVSFFGVYHYTSATNAVTPQDADVNHNGAVTIADAISVLPHIGQLAPIAAIPQIVGDRGFMRLPSGAAQLINTSTGAVVATYP